MMDLIDRRAAIEAILKGKVDEDESLVECPAECNSMIDGAIEDIKALPSVDVVEVVRCKECIHYWKNWKDGEPDDEVAVCLASPRDDAFCSEGERREDE